jgi:hypothetical protein
MNDKAKKSKVMEKATRAKVAEPEVLCQSLMPAPLNQGKTALEASPNLNYIFFEPTRAVPDGPFVSPIVGMARMLKALGVNPDDLKASMIVSMALNSARLGYSIPTILLSKEPSAAVKVLHRCMQVTPSVSFIEFQKMTQEDLFLGSPQIRERTVTSSDENGFKKVRQDVDLLLSRGNSTTQELIRSKFGVGLQSRRVEIPLSLVGVAPDRASSVLQHPSLLWVSVRGEQEKAVAQAPRTGNGDSNPLLDVEVARLQKTFERLCWHPVDVPFAEQIMGALKDVKSLPVCQVENIFKVLCMSAIINNPPPVQWDEIVSLMYGVGREKVGSWLAAKKDIAIPVVQIGGSPTLVATKVDYFFAWLLLDKILPVGEFILTPRQNHVLDVLKRLNMAGISNAHINNKSVVEILSTIANSTNAWMTREKVFEILNKDGGEYVSLSTVNNELQYLLKVGIVDRKKPPKQNQYRYYILTLDAGQYLTLPHPSEINDPIYQGKPVEVVNPLTGAVEKI